MVIVVIVVDVDVGRDVVVRVVVVVVVDALLVAVRAVAVVERGHFFPKENQRQHREENCYA